MADITLTYKGATIAEISATGTKTIETAGKYCEADIGLAYVKPGGGGDAGDFREATKYATNFVLSLTGDETLPERVKLSVYRAANNSFKIGGNWADRGIRYLDIYDFPAGGLQINNLIAQTSNIDTVSFISDGDIVVNSMNGAFSSTNVKHIVGTLDVSAAASAWALQAFGSTNLYDITFKASTIKYNLSFSSCSNLTDASLASIANGLDGSASGQSLTLHATPKARCSTLMGTNNGGTFEITSGGTLSLADFITTVKGWTLA
jgi:hypothetical protein